MGEAVCHCELAIVVPFSIVTKPVLMGVVGLAMDVLRVVKGIEECP